MNGNKAITLGPAHQICDQTIEYEALGQTTRCRLRLYRLDRAYVALLSEDPSNAGSSLHNTIEDALAYTREQWEILPKNLVAIEQRLGPGDGEESFSRVSVRWMPADGRMVVDRPRWSATTRAHVERVVGEPV